MRVEELLQVLGSDGLVRGRREPERPSQQLGHGGEGAVGGELGTSNLQPLAGNDVLSESRHEPRLADASRPTDAQATAGTVATGFEPLLEQPQLVLTPDHRRRATSWPTARITDHPVHPHGSLHSLEGGRTEVVEQELVAEPR